MAVKTKKAPMMILAQISKGTAEYRIRVEEHGYTRQDGSESRWVNNILEVKFLNIESLNDWNKVDLGRITSQEVIDIMAAMLSSLAQPLG